MRYTKYLFTPIDVAMFIRIADLTVSRRSEVMTDLFGEYNASLVYPFRNDFVLFNKTVNSLLEKYEMDSSELTEIEMIMREVNGISTEQTFEPDYFCAYFKQIKLRLLFTQNYVRMKLTTLLSDFGYKRRTQGLLETLRTTIKKLGLVTYIGGYELCDIGEENIHTMIIFRLERLQRQVQTEVTANRISQKQRDGRAFPQNGA
ncbi:MAG: hypothetical protein NC120_10345 [Ruminococcus sp.]|nr:hypothetical protein [Ruminococcus sp.]